MYRVDQFISVIKKKKSVFSKGRFLIDGVSIVKLLNNRRKKVIVGIFIFKLELRKIRGTSCRLLRKIEVHVKRKITLKLCKLHPHEIFNKNFKDKLENFSQIEAILVHPNNATTNEAWESDGQDNGCNRKKNNHISNQIGLKFM